MIDNRGGPGTTKDFVRPSGNICPAVGEGKLFESATKVCGHCSQMILLNPDRKRERHYCPNCDDFICDVCAEIRKNTLECGMMKKAYLEKQESEAIKLNLSEV